MIHVFNSCPSGNNQLPDEAFSRQLSANSLSLMSFAESRKLMADSANPKTLVSG
jgi:hypothetical protein